MQRIKKIKTIGSENFDKSALRRELDGWLTGVLSLEVN